MALVVRVVGAVTGFLYLVTIAVSVTYRPIDAFGILVNVVPMLAFFLAGMVVLWSQPESQSGRWLLGVGVCGAAMVASTALSPRLGWSGWPVFLLGTVPQCLLFAAWLGIFATFPSPELDRGYERVAVAVAVVAAVVLPVIAVVASPRLTLMVPPVDHPPVVASPIQIGWLAPFANAFTLLYVLPVVALVLLVIRYRRGDESLRRRMRWPLFACAIAAVFFAASALFPGLNVYVSSVLFVAATTSVPVAVAIGLARPSLFDIDLLIRRSPVYALLWLAIAAVYATVSAILGITAGQRLSVGTAVAVTVIAAVLFQPARDRLERIADRIVYGQRLDGYALLRGLAHDLEKAPHAAAVGPRVAAAVADGVGAAWSRVVLTETSGDVVVGTAGHPVPPAELVLPLVYRDETIGRLECGPRGAEPYSEADIELLAAVARQVALALHDARQSHELAASRTRLVQAAQAERRRIERDLHDGVQQELVALMAKIEVARRSATGDPAVTEALNDAVQLARSSLRGVRELAHGIHPAVLTDEGLAAAVHARAAALPIGVHLEVAPEARGRRFAADSEAAAYFMVSEALTNAIKHSGTDECWIRIGLCQDQLDVIVDDAGRGIEPKAHLRGLRGIEDRLGALGGRLEVGPRPGSRSGTRVRALLPA